MADSATHWLLVVQIWPGGQGGLHREMHVPFWQKNPARQPGMHGASAANAGAEVEAGASCVSAAG